MLRLNASVWSIAIETPSCPFHVWRFEVSDLVQFYSLYFSCRISAEDSSGWHNIDFLLFCHPLDLLMRLMLRSMKTLYEFGRSCRAACFCSSVLFSFCNCSWVMDLLKGWKLSHLLGFVLVILPGFWCWRTQLTSRRRIKTFCCLSKNLVCVSRYSFAI